MPYKFTFKVDDNHEFTCVLHSEQCQFIKQNGDRCKLKTILGSPYCFIHLKYHFHLTIKPSLIPNSGKGLFAFDPKKDANAIIFKKGDKIMEYKGELITNDELEERYGNKTAPYSVKINKDLYQDCSCKRGSASIANTYPNHNNATLLVHRKKVFIKATKNIRNNEEIYLSYGRNFRLNEENVEHETKYIRRP